MLFCHFSIRVVELLNDPWKGCCQSQTPKSYPTRAFHHTATNFPLCPFIPQWNIIFVSLQKHDSEWLSWESSSLRWKGTGYAEDEAGMFQSTQFHCYFLQHLPKLHLAVTPRILVIFYFLISLMFQNFKGLEYFKSQTMLCWTLLRAHTHVTTNQVKVFCTFIYSDCVLYMLFIA